MFERFTDRARTVLVLAQEEARILGHGYIGPEHLLLGLIHEGGGVAARALTFSGASLELVRLKVAAIRAPALDSSGSPPFTPRAKKALELSLREAVQRGDSYIGTEHLLLGLLRQEDGEVIDLLTDVGIDFDQIRARVVQEMTGLPDGPIPQLSASFAREQISAAFSNLAVSDDGQAVPMVERGDDPGPALSSVAERGVTLAVSVVEIAFARDGAAVVWFDAVVDGTPVLTRHRGGANLIDGAWKMEHRTFAQIMTAAGVPLPPD